MREMKETLRDWGDGLKRITTASGVPDLYRPVIMYLFHNPGSTQKDIAAFHRITAASVSRTISEMLVEGYITKVVDSKDGRYLHLYLTEKGTDAANRIRERIQSAEQMVIDAITPEKEAEMLDCLEKIREAIARELRKDDGRC